MPSFYMLVGSIAPATEPVIIIVFYMQHGTSGMFVIANVKCEFESFMQSTSMVGGRQTGRLTDVRFIQTKELAED